VGKRRCAGGTANDRNAWRPPKSGEAGSDRCEACDTQNVARLQQSWTISLDQVDAGHDLATKAFCRLVGTRGKNYISGLNGPLASGLNISDQREPTGSRALCRNCPVRPENPAVWRGRDHRVHRLPHQGQKLTSALQRHSAVSHRQELPGKRMVP
jgi:hypothetical protein